MTRSLLLLSLAFAAPAATASPWLCTDQYGLKSFSYEPKSATDPRCVDHPIPSGNVWRVRPQSETAAGEPREFPRVDAKTQRGRDVARRKILERELAEEKKSLAEAIRELAELKQARIGLARAVPDSELKRYEQRIRTHETNIANLERELGRPG